MAAFVFGCVHVFDQEELFGKLAFFYNGDWVCRCTECGKDILAGTQTQAKSAAQEHAEQEHGWVQTKSAGKQQ